MENSYFRPSTLLDLEDLQIQGGVQVDSSESLSSSN